MSREFVRTEKVLGPEAMRVIRSSKILLFGVGGVGGNCAEALARCGIGKLTLVDHDDVAVSNINRQVFALHSTVGMKKTEAARQRIKDISPDTEVICCPVFYLPGQCDEINFSEYDYIIDAIDTVTAKLDIIEQAAKCGVPVISAMGCGNRTDPSKLCIRDLFETKGDPLAKVMRRELRKRGITKLTVCCSDEPPIKPLITEEEETLPAGKRAIPGSTAFVPPAAGILIASYVIRQLSAGKR